jgi:hypothetical protein
LLKILALAAADLRLWLSVSCWTTLLGMDIKLFSKAFVWVVMSFGLKNVSPMYQRVVNNFFKDYLNDFMKFLNDFTIFNDLDTHLLKLQ